MNSFLFTKYTYYLTVPTLGTGNNSKFKLFTGRHIRRGDKESLPYIILSFKAVLPDNGLGEIGSKLFSVTDKLDTQVYSMSARSEFFCAELKLAPRLKVDFEQLTLRHK